MTGFDPLHVELALGPSTLSQERMLAAQRRELEELRCHTATCDDGDHREMDDLDARDLAARVDRLAARLERTATKPSPTKEAS